MDFALWAYAWDLLDEGVESFAETAAGIGVSEVNLATNYHTVQTFLPHNPDRRTFFAHPSAYFQPGDGYGRLEPVPNETMGDQDWLAAIADGLRDTQVSLNSWTVGCHNSRLGMANPDLTLESPFGDALVFGLCPSQPAVREFLVALVEDLSSRGVFDRIELESFDYLYGTGYGWHHAKYHTRLGTLGEYLFGLCFCDRCRATAADAGVDVDRARRTCRETIDDIAEGDLPHDLDVAGWLAAHPAVADYADVRAGTLAEVFEGIAGVAGDADLGYYVGLLGVEDAWMHGADLDRLASSVDYYTVIAYEETADAVSMRLSTADRLTPEIPLHAGLLPAHPAVYDGATVRAQVDEAAAAGAERVSFYNYGLLPERSLGWIGAATEPHR